MKRSKMLSKIASVIINYNEAHCIINRDKAMEMAEVILGIQEENGMLPPEIKEQSFKILPSGEMVYNVNEWEPE